MVYWLIQIYSFYMAVQNVNYIPNGVADYTYRFKQKIPGHKPGI